MRKIFWTILFLATITQGLLAQTLEKSRVVSLIPALNTEVNGLAIGLMIQSLKFNDDTTTTRINGLNLEIIGAGFFGPLVPSNPLVPYNLSIDQIGPIVDSLVTEAKTPKSYKVNGLNISLGGLAGHEVQMSGLNLSGVSTITSRTYGVSISTLMNMNKVMHGLSIGAANYSLEHKGLQIGLFNRSEKTRGIQIGLINKNERRTLPLINWNFKRRTQNKEKTQNNNGKRN